MEVVAAPPPTSNGTPFRDHDVREWSRIDTITGALERARLETDSWSATTSDACHRYGKVVDSRARTGVNGNLQAQASRQLEVFQSRTSGARLQVVKTKTVSSSRWSSTNKGDSTPIAALGFEDLKLPLNPLDLTSQKSKASVGRTVNRRPPTRHPRNLNSTFASDVHSHIRNAQFTAATNLHRVSRLCHQIHESAVRNAFGRKSPENSRRASVDDSSVSGVEITEIENSSATSNSDLNSHQNLMRTKSNSSDDINLIPEKDSIRKSVEDLEDLEQLQNWRRNSKVRRSLQFPKATSPELESNDTDLPESSVNVKKLRDRLEKGRRLTAALRNNSISADLNALDDIIRSISSASSLERSSTDDNLDEICDKESVVPKTKNKRESFVTVESIQEVKGRLRRTSSPGSDVYSKNKDDSESDDGIDTEDTSLKVKSYVYGMENNMVNLKKPVIGTGSLESRSKFSNGINNHKNEDWYNRRKSYGFEKVHGSEEPSSISLKNKNFVESSTDSGICRSSEIMVVPTATKSNNFDDVENEKTNPINGIHYGNVKKMTSIFDHQEDELSKAWTKRAASFKDDWKKNEIKSTTITIPIVKNNNVVDLSWNEEPEKEAKRVSAESNGDRFRKTSLNDPFLINNDDDNLNNINRKGKKVEFCKTEVHFAAESGKVNIVETDEKPPPTQNFRRRRRNSGPIRDYPEDFNKNGLPMLHFGDSSYEKTMFGIDNEQDEKQPPLSSLEQNRIPSAFSVVTVNNTNDYILEEDERKELLLTDNDNLKGILKNKPIKPKPYHLGDNVSLNDDDEDARRWGVRLRHVPEENLPIWKSTVTVHNNYQQDKTKSEPPEFQKLLKNLRPTTKKPDYLSDNENRYSDNLGNIRVVSAVKDNRRSSWSVADKVKLVDDIQENKGYSTKVNFGNGEATVVQNDQSTWPRMENLSKDSKQILNKGLVVRIGRQDSASKHTVCSKTTRQNNSTTTTTTKITIDLAPSPPTKDKPLTYTKFKRSQNLQHSFKSTPLVLNMLKDQKEAVNKVPQQLEALRKLYNDVPSDEAECDADREVQQLLSRVTEKELTSLESDASSVVSGSWSKMKAFKNFAEASNRSSFRGVKSKFDLKNAKDIEDVNSPRLKKVEDSAKPTATYNKYSILHSGSKFSPVVLRKSIPIMKTTESVELKPSEELSSIVNKKSESSIINNRHSPTREFKNLPDAKLQAKYVNENIVLRQPKKSEMTYFGVNVASRENVQTAVIKKDQKPLLQKPDILQHHHKRPPSPQRIVKPRRPLPDKNKESPIYENLKPAPLKSKYSGHVDFDSSILDELTKAADQILLAVNGYTSEDCHTRLSSDEEESRKPLDTISETKSWKHSNQDLEIKNQQRMRPTLASAAKMKVKRTSSTSSVESLSKDPRRRGSLTERRSTTTPLVKSAPTEKPNNKKKPSTEVTSIKATTKARRLQRASSREALLQSHGSSSEDLPANIEAPARKPRLIKKTKTAQLTMTNGLELKKPTRRRSREEKVETGKNDTRILGSLPEIRHKTAVSTITSTAEKCSRDRSRTRNDDSKSRSYTKREGSGKGKYNY
ncbi:unnamed protein product [Ceutorhynchus assimilis]|uniref:Uncharacterized protein n=1 Tax=Ceutorhynchus assimilis TaxID=467358 RepID=A0A9N9MET2_9CUCU|nr:unnamed protein product [Ceutorhynchus assimilis]